MIKQVTKFEFFEHVNSFKNVVYHTIRWSTPRRYNWYYGGRIDDDKMIGYSYEAYDKDPAEYFIQDTT